MILQPPEQHLISATPGNNNLGTVTPVLSHDSTGFGTGAVVSWTFTLLDSDMQFLRLGQTTETYAVTVSDRFGGSETQNVTVNVVNPDHVPVTSSGPQEGIITGNLDGTVTTGQII